MKVEEIRSTNTLPLRPFRSPRHHATSAPWQAPPRQPSSMPPRSSSPCDRPFLRLRALPSSPTRLVPALPPPFPPAVRAAFPSVRRTVAAACELAVGGREAADVSVVVGTPDVGRDIELEGQALTARRQVARGHLGVLCGRRRVRRPMGEAGEEQNGGRTQSGASLAQ